MTRVFFDMDGVLAEWNTSASIEEVASPGYFRNRVPMVQMLDAAKRLIESGEVEVYILSAVYLNVYSNLDKYKWLKSYLPEVNDDNIIFVPYGEPKVNYIDSPTTEDVLVDDYTKNLYEWPGIGVKCINGINNTKGTWMCQNKPFVVANEASKAIAEKILGYCA